MTNKCSNLDIKKYLNLNVPISCLIFFKVTTILLKHSIKGFKTNSIFVNVVFEYNSNVDISVNHFCNENDKTRQLNYYFLFLNRNL